MAVSFIEPLLNTWRADAGEDGHRTYSLSFRVTTDSTNDGPRVVGQAADAEWHIPAIKEAYAFGPDEYDAHALCVKASPEQEAPKIWRVDCEWTTNTSQYANPLDEPPQVSGSARGDGQEAFLEDVETLDAVLNSAHCPYQEQPTRRKSKETLTVTVNKPCRTGVPTDDPRTWAFQYVCKLNNANWNGYGEGAVMCTGISWTKESAMVAGAVPPLVSYYKITYDFEIDEPDRWVIRTLDQGFKSIAQPPLANAGEIVNIKDDNDEDIAEPMLLDGNGDVLDADADAVFLEWNAYFKVDFSTLGITL